VSLITLILLAALIGLTGGLVFLPRPEPEEVARLRPWVFRSIMVAEWWLVTLFLLLLLLDAQELRRFGLAFSFGHWRVDLAWAVGITAVAIVLGEAWWYVGRRRGWSGLEFIRALLPRTREEKWLALALAATAGFCEEFLYRGFAITVLGQLLGSVWLAGGIVVLLFALAHAPYGKLGVTSALTAGAALTLAFIATGRLTACIVSHFAYDCYAFFASRFGTTNTHR